MFYLLKFIIPSVKEIVNRTQVLLARHRDLLIEVILGAATGVLYLRTMPPTVLDGDSAEFQYMAHILGVPHSSGYPLYILIAKLFTLLPFGDVAYRVNLFSVVSAALTIPLVYAVALRLIGKRVPSLLATLIFAVTPSVWGGALETKTYALHLLLGVLCVLFALRWHQQNTPHDFYALAFTFGLGLVNHHVIVFIAPALAVVVWFNRARLALRRAMIARGALLALLPLVLYAYIPIRAEYFISQQDPENWKLYTRADAFLTGTVSAYYRHSLDGFLNLITGFDNSYKIKSPLDDDRMALAATLLLQQFGIAGIALSALGAFESFRRDRKLFSIIFLVALGIGAIATVLRGISAVFYFSLAYLALALWIGFGIDAFMQWSARAHRATPYAVAAVLLALPISALVINYSNLDESKNYAPRDYAQTVLHDNLAQNAVVIAPWEVSQPMRYFQFVENQRLDLLVVNVSPVSKQFETMMTNARVLQRPFYLAQFDPEDRLATGSRTVQAIPIPLLQEPNPRYGLRDVRIVPEAQVLGFELDPDPPMPGKPARVLVYYRTLARVYPMYSAQLTVSDVTGKLWGEYSGFPGSFYFPTYRWQVGDFYRDAWQLNLPADAPAGLYRLDLSWFVYDLDAGKPDSDREFKVSLGTIRVGDVSVNDIAHPQTARVSDAVSFLGWNSNVVSVSRGESINLDLFWRADRAVSESYTVFVHLVDAEGRVVTDADSPPSSGLFPTNLWKPGEGLRDRHILKIPADLAPGNYSLEIGMYLPANSVRLPIESASNRADKLVLTQVRVR